MAESYSEDTPNASFANHLRSSISDDPCLLSSKEESALYWLLEGTMTTSLKFLAAALINDMPPISIFSIMSFS